MVSLLFSTKREQLHLICSETERDALNHRPAMASWRNASINDIDGIALVSNEIHTDLPESKDVFAERIRLFPQGCMVLVDGQEICGYAISHPIRSGQPPTLDTLLGAIDANADTYYIHDVAVSKRLRGQGYAAECVDRLLKVARQCPETCLISVYGTTSFWARFGFVPGPVGPALSEKLRGYGVDARYLCRRNE